MQVVGTVIEAELPGVSVGAIADVGSTRAEVVGFRENRALLMPLGSLQGITHGDPVQVRRDALTIPVGQALMGRVIDPLGQPLDGLFDRGIAGEGLAARDAEKRLLLLDPGVGSRFVVLGLTGLIALCRVLESRINNFLAVDIAIEAVETIRDERWS